MEDTSIRIFAANGDRIWGDGYRWNYNTKRIDVNETFDLAKGTYYLVFENDINKTGNYNFNIDYNKKANTLTAKAKKAKMSVNYSGTKSRTTACNVSTSKAIGNLTYANASSNATAKKLSVNKSNGKVTVPKKIKAGTYVVKVKVTTAGNSSYKAGSKTVSYKIVVNKVGNPLTVKAVTKTAKYATVKKKAVTVARPIAVSKAQGALSYKKAGGSKFLTVSANTGKVTVKKGTKKGTYTIKIKVTAKGNANFKAKSTTVTCKVVVK